MGKMKRRETIFMSTRVIRTGFRFKGNIKKRLTQYNKIYKDLNNF